MVNNLTVSSSPHLSNSNPISANKVWTIMLDVLIALLPATVCAIVFFGINVLLNVLICVASCVVAEYVFVVIKTKQLNPLKTSVKDLSAVVTGLLLALNVPATLDLWWQLIVASVFAIVIVKLLFGGIGKNFANPAMAARILMIVSFGAAMTTNSVNTFTNLLATKSTVDGVNITTAATWLGSLETKVPIADMLVGFVHSSAVGEVSAIALLAGGAYLVVRQVIDWKIPVSIIGSVIIFALLFSFAEAPAIVVEKIGLFHYIASHVLSGGLLLGAIFMATDYATSPNSTIGVIVYGCGIGFLAMLIRVFVGTYPEGVSFAIVIMNIVAPLIDKYIVPKPFGYVKPVKTKKEAA